jgi:hypothetical protein
MKGAFVGEKNFFNGNILQKAGAFRPVISTVLKIKITIFRP